MLREGGYAGKEISLEMKLTTTQRMGFTAMDYAEEARIPSGRQPGVVA